MSKKIEKQNWTNIEAPYSLELPFAILPEIEDIAIVGIPDETWGDVGHAFVIRKPAANLDAEDIINFCKERLAAFKCPRKITFCKEFPRTSLGKVLKRELIKEENRAL